MTNYVITEEQLSNLEDYRNDGFTTQVLVIGSCVRDNPLSSALLAERERVLCELLAYINPDSRAGCVIKEKLGSLRSEQP